MTELFSKLVVWCYIPREKVRVLFFLILPNTSYGQSFLF